MKKRWSLFEDRLRRTSCFSMSGNLGVVQEALGHASIRTMATLQTDGLA
jgi:integrase